MAQAFKPLGDEFSAQYNTKINKPAFLEALINYGTLVDVSATLNNIGTTTLYTVPVGKVFFLFTIKLNSSSNAFSATAACQLNLVNPSGSTILLQHKFVYAADTAHRLYDDTDFSTPKRLQAGDYLQLQNINSLSTDSTAIIFGYEIDSTLIPAMLTIL